MMETLKKIFSGLGLVVYLLVLGACAPAEQQSGSSDDPLKTVDSEATATPTPAEGDAGKEGGEGP
jgi:hypothetical protein